MSFRMVSIDVAEAGIPVNLWTICERMGNIQAWHGSSELGSCLGGPSSNSSNDTSL
jgi:hypothetical protein